MSKKLARYFVVFAFIFWIANRVQIKYSYGDFKSYTDVLLNVSGMVFTLMGIWIAFLYPNALSRLVNPNAIAVADFSETLEETRRLEAIVASVLKSGTVVVAILAISLFKLFLYSIEIIGPHMGMIKSGALAFISTLSIIQAEAVFEVLKANVMFLNDLHSKRESRQMDAE